MEVGHEVLEALGIDSHEVGDFAGTAAVVSFLEAEDEGFAVDGDDYGGADSEAAGEAFVKVVSEAVNEKKWGIWECYCSV